MVTTKGLAAKERIIRVAAELFYRNGYHAVGLNQVLDIANAPKGSFYYYFRSKEELARETIHYFAGLVLGRLREELLSPDLTSGTNAIRNFVESVANDVQDDANVGPCPLSSVGLQVGTLTAELADLLKQYLDRFCDDLRVFFEYAEIRGELLVPGISGLLAEEFLYIYEGSLIISSVQRSTLPFRDAFDVFLATHFKPD
jgi:AcrR family transcriptional regulator